MDSCSRLPAVHIHIPRPEQLLCNIDHVGNFIDDDALYIIQPAFVGLFIGTELLGIRRRVPMNIFSACRLLQFEDFSVVVLFVVYLSPLGSVAFAVYILVLWVLLPLPYRQEVAFDWPHERVLVVLAYVLDRSNRL